ncbi:hypothetical protein, partial [Halorubrum sp. Atlit-26R]|uniref:hypothetical protein n=1 Tax=Halorubrum sp. Atlit-26R TaxID=2282128 RepID=UPI000F159B32
STPGLDVRLNVDGGQTYTVESFTSDTLTGTSAPTDLRSFTVSLNGSAVGDLAPGLHTIEFEVTEGSDAYLDFAHVRDTRYNYDTDDTTPDSGVVTGWQQYPAAIDVEFPVITSVEQVVGGGVRATMGEETSAPPVAVGVRNDQTNGYTEVTGATSVETEFAAASQLIQARVTLGREDSDGGESGTFGDVPQRLD